MVWPKADFGEVDSSILKETTSYAWRVMSKKYG